MEDIEIEVKFPLRNPEELAQSLDTKAQALKKKIFQKDTYYVPAHRNFLAAKFPFEWLRVRESEKGFSLDYKHFYPENVEKSDYCDEFETKLDNIKAMRKILKSLDFKEIVVVEKTRSTWLFNNVEIAIDKVEGAGDFIELEAKRKFDDPKDGKKYLYSVLKELNAKVGEEDLRGYPAIILEKRSQVL